MTECERCASLQQQVTDRDRFIQIDRSIITQRDAEVERLREAIQEAGTLLSFEAELGPPAHQATLREIVRQLTEALERPGVSPK